MPNTRKPSSTDSVRDEERGTQGPPSVPKLVSLNPTYAPDVTVIGVDDTDSRERGMCTTYLAAAIADRLRETGGADGDEAASVERSLLVRLNPAVEHKTRGNAALAVHTDADPERAFELAREEVARVAETDDPRTNPGLVVGPGDPGDVPEEVADFARSAVRDRLAIEEAE